MATPETPESTEVTFSVPEMDCASCATKVEGALSRLDGVEGVEGSPTSGRARVRYDPEHVDTDAIAEAIEAAGYDVAGRRGGEESAIESGDAVADPKAVWTSPRALKTWLGALLLVAGLAVEFLLPATNAVVATVLGIDLTVADAFLLAATASSGVPVVRAGYRSARARSLDIDLLMGSAILAATAVGYYVEAATLAVLFSIAELLESYAMDRARDSLRELVELSPEEATVRRAGGEETVPVEEVAVGEVVVVRPGERVPMDGVVREGHSAVDESPVTGESVPVDKSIGDDVYAGSVNSEGYLEVEVTAEAAENTLARVVELVQQAEAEKAEREQFVERFADYYTPAVVALAILTAAVPPLALGGDPGTWFVRGLTLLVIACPCAFVISTPVSVVSAITSAARTGVLVKGGTYLESMGEVGAVAFDKTGTLTRGELAVTDTFALGDASRADVLALARALETRSEHPLAWAVVEHAEAVGVDGPVVSEFESLTGRGVRATVDGETYYAGNPDLFDSLGVAVGERPTRATDGGRPADVEADNASDPGLTERIDRLQGDGKTVILVGTDERVLGGVAVADELRPEASRAVARLQERGVRTVMLTGDNEGTARAVARAVGIGDIHAGLLPEEKVDAVEELRESHDSVAMVGDGVNDAPALAAATVGVAMGAAGSDTALETADVALLGDDLRKLPYLHDLARRANRVIRQNIWASLGAKALLAVGVPFGYVGVAAAVVIGDMGMSLGVTGNALRLSRVRPESPDAEAGGDGGAEAAAGR